MSGWVPVGAVALRWNMRLSSTMRMLRTLATTGAVEIREDQQAVRLTWPQDIVASFAAIDRWSTTGG